MSIEAMKQALRALEYYRSAEDYQPTHASEAITALRQAIEQAEKQEPVAWIVDGEIRVRLDMAGKLYYSETNVYAAPVHASDISQERVDETAKDRYDWNEIQCPCGHKMYAKYTRREWVELTDEEVNQGYADTADEFQFYQVIEAKLREKNA